MDVKIIICLIFVVLASLPETSENRYDALQSNDEIDEDGEVERLLQDGSDELSDDDDDDYDDNNEILRHDPRPFSRRRRFRTCFRKKKEQYVDGFVFLIVGYIFVLIDQFVDVSSKISHYNKTIYKNLLRVK